MRNIFLALIIVLALGCEGEKVDEVSTCSSIEPEAAMVSPTVTQGLYGLVTFTEGNCMPGIGGSGSCRTCPVKRTVRFYEYTLPKDIVSGGLPASFFQSFRTRLIAEAESDIRGFYQVALPPGTYSMVVVEDGKLYANLSDGQGGVNPVTVAAGLARRDLGITYKAVY